MIWPQSAPVYLGWVACRRSGCKVNYRSAVPDNTEHLPRFMRVRWSVGRIHDRNKPGQLFKGRNKVLQFVSILGSRTRRMKYHPHIPSFRVFVVDPFSLIIIQHRLRAPSRMYPGVVLFILSNRQRRLPYHCQLAPGGNRQADKHIHP